MLSASRHASRSSADWDKFNARNQCLSESSRQDRYVRAIGNSREANGKEHDDIDHLDDVAWEVQNAQFFQAKLHCAQEENDQLHRQVHALTQNLTVTTEELSRRMQLFSDSCTEQHRLETELKELKNDIKKKDAELHEMSLKQSNLHKVVEEQNLQIEKEKDIHALLADRFEKLQIERKNWKMQVANCRKKVECTLYAVENTKKEKQRLEAENKSLLVQIEQYKKNQKENDEFDEEEKKKLLNKVSKLQEELAALQHDRAFKVAESERDRDWKVQLDATIASDQEHLQKLNSELQRQRLAATEAHIKVADVTKELHEIRLQLYASKSAHGRDTRRHEQEMRGKDKEVDFIWNRYQNAVRSKLSCPEKDEEMTLSEEMSQ